VHTFTYVRGLLNGQLAATTELEHSWKCYHTYSINAPFTHSIWRLTTQINTELAEFPTRQGVRGHFGVARALRSCFVGSACGWKLCRLGIPPQARKSYGLPILLWWLFIATTLWTIPSYRFDSSFHPNSRINNWNIHVIRTVFPRANLKPISSQLSRIWRSERTINRP
jgi:hypothetical protein